MRCELLDDARLYWALGPLALAIGLPLQLAAGAVYLVVRRLGWRR